MLATSITFYYTSKGKAIIHIFLPIGVNQEFWKVEKLGYKFFDVSSFRVDGFPRGWDVMKLSVRAVKPPALQFNVKSGEGFYA